MPDDQVAEVGKLQPHGPDEDEGHKTVRGRGGDLRGKPAAKSGADDGDAIEAPFFQESLVKDRQVSDVVELARGFRMTAAGVPRRNQPVSCRESGKER